jgi:hypothetical protein
VAAGSFRAEADLLRILRVEAFHERHPALRQVILHRRSSPGWPALSHSYRSARPELTRQENDDLPALALAAALGQALIARIGGTTMEP